MLATYDERRLIEEASQPRVAAVLFYAERLRQGLPPFYSWVAREYQLAGKYGGDKELWIRRPGN